MVTIADVACCDEIERLKFCCMVAGGNASQNSVPRLSRLPVTTGSILSCSRKT